MDTSSYFPSITDPGLPSTSFMLANVSLVFIMTPALGFFYAGLSRSQNALTILTLSFQCMIIVAIQWFLFGFSLAFSETGSSFVGNFKYAFLMNVDISALPFLSVVPGVAYCLHHLQYAAITPAIIFGSVAERVRILPAMVFIFLWTTFVYDFVVYWTWATKGWHHNLSCLDTLDCHKGADDFAGGGPIHIASGFAGLAYCLIIGKREVRSRATTPHNLSNVVLGTALLWMSWFRFTGGAANAPTPRAAMAALVTALSAAFSGFTWSMIDYFRIGKMSTVSVCSGVLAGLVAITPASGFISTWAGAVMGITAGFLVNLSFRVKNYLGYDDTLDAFALHGMGGVIGGIMTGILNQKSIAAIDGNETDGGVIDGNWKSLGYQTAAVVTIAVWSFILSYAILFFINEIPGLHLRITAEEELKGQDPSEIGEAAYEFQSMIFGKKSGSRSKLHDDKFEMGKKSNLEIMRNEVKADVVEV